MARGEQRLGPAYRQDVWVRAYRPGPWRVALLIAAAGLGSYLALVAVVSLGTAGSPSRTAVVAAGAAVALGGWAWLIVRVLRVGLWVSDDGLREIRIGHAVTWPWADVHAVGLQPQPVRLLGLGPSRAGHAVTVETSDAEHPTVLTSLSPDFLGRAEAFDIAVSAVHNWARRA